MVRALINKPYTRLEIPKLLRYNDWANYNYLTEKWGKLNGKH